MLSYKLYTAWAKLPPAPAPAAPAATATTDQLRETGVQEAELVQLVHGDTPPPSYDECVKNHL